MRVRSTEQTKQRQKSAQMRGTESAISLKIYGER